MQTTPLSFTVSRVYHSTAYTHYLTDLIAVDGTVLNITITESRLVNSATDKVPPQIFSIIYTLNDFRQTLVSRFCEVEKRTHEPNYQISFNAADGLYPSLCQYLRQIADTLAEKNLCTDTDEEENRTYLVGKKPLRAWATAASNTGTRLSCDDGNEPSSRAAKSQKTSHGTSAGARSAPARYPLRSRTTSSGR